MAYQMLEFQRDSVQTQNTKTEILSQSTEVSGNQLDQGRSKKIKKERKQKTVRKAKTPYSPTKIKARNFLSNIAYKRICEKDFSNICFIIDVFSFITMDLKPFFLTASYFDVEDRDMIKMLWEECIPQGYYNYVKRPENFETLNSTKTTFKDVKKIVQNYLQQPNTWSEIIRYFTSYYSIYQYVYSLLFPKSYANTSMGQNTKIKFFLCFERWRPRKREEQTAKNPFNFAVADEVITHPLEQKPITDSDQFQPYLPKRSENFPLPLKVK